MATQLISGAATEVMSEPTAAGTLQAAISGKALETLSDTSSANMAFGPRATGTEQTSDASKANLIMAVSGTATEALLARNSLLGGTYAQVSPSGGGQGGFGA